MFSLQLAQLDCHRYETSMCVCGFVNQYRYWKQYVSPRDIIYSIQMVRFPYLCENLLESMHPTKNAETNGRIDDLSTLHSTSSNHSLLIQHVFLENSPRVWGTVSIENRHVRRVSWQSSFSTNPIRCWWKQFWWKKVYFDLMLHSCKLT